MRVFRKSIMEISMKKLFFTLILLVTLASAVSCKINLGKPNPPEIPPEEFTVFSPEVKVSLVVGSENATDDDRRGYDALRASVTSLLSGGYLIKTDDYNRSEENPSEIVVGHTRREISELAYEYLDGKDALPVGYSHFVIYCHEGAVAIAGDGEYAMDAAVDYFLDMFVNGQTTLVLDYDLVEYVTFSVASHEAMLNAEYDAKEAEALAERWALLEAQIGKDAADAVKKLYDYYGNEWVTWSANLYDPNTGFFYYSNSARDNDTVTYGGVVYDLLPDVESTCQTLDMMQELGLFRKFNNSWTGALPEEMQIKCLAYAQAMQSEDDGYFYHPQWRGINTSSTRRGRDYSQALLIIRKLGGTPLYTPANDRIENGTAQGTASVIAAFMESDAHKSSVTLTNSSLPSHLQSEEALRAYIDYLMAHNSCHGVGHILSSQASQIKAAGLGDACIAYLDTFQDPETGHFYNRRYEEHEYDKVSAIIKLSSLYSALGARMKYMDKVIDSAIATICSSYEPSDHNICFIYNAWGGLGAAMGNVAANNDPDATDNTNIEVVRAKVLARLPEMIDATISKLSKFRYDDGSFSFKPGMTSPVMEGSPVAIITGQYGNNIFYGLPEGDVNATTVAIYYTLNGLFSVLDVSRIPLLTYADYREFIKIINEKEAALGQ